MLEQMGKQSVKDALVFYVIEDMDELVVVLEFIGEGDDALVELKLLRSAYGFLA